MFLSEEVPARCSRRFFVSSPILLETLNWGGVGQLSPIRAVIVIRSFCHVAVLDYCVSLSIIQVSLNLGGVGQLSPIRTVIVRRRSCTQQLQVLVSPLQHFLRLPLWAELRSYPLLELLLPQEEPASSSRWFLCLLVNTSYNFQPGWSWAAISYESCYWKNKLLHGAVKAFCASSSIIFETLNWGGVRQLSPIRAVIVTWSSCRVEVLGFSVSLSILYESPDQTGFGQLSPAKSC